MLQRRRLAGVLFPFFGFRLSCGVLSLLALTTASSVLWAQATSSATVTGQATDQQGAAVPGPRSN